MLVFPGGGALRLCLTTRGTKKGTNILRNDTKESSYSPKHDLDHYFEQTSAKIPEQTIFRRSLLTSRHLRTFSNAED